MKKRKKIKKKIRKIIKKKVKPTRNKNLPKTLLFKKITVTYCYNLIHEKA